MWWKKELGETIEHNTNPGDFYDPEQQPADGPTSRGWSIKSKCPNKSNVVLPFPRNVHMKTKRKKRKKWGKRGIEMG